MDLQDPTSIFSGPRDNRVKESKFEKFPVGSVCDIIREKLSLCPQDHSIVINHITVITSTIGLVNQNMPCLRIRVTYCPPQPIPLKHGDGSDIVTFQSLTSLWNRNEKH